MAKRKTRIYLMVYGGSLQLWAGARWHKPAGKSDWKPVDVLWNDGCKPKRRKKGGR